MRVNVKRLDALRYAESKLQLTQKQLGSTARCNRSYAPREPQVANALAELIHAVLKSVAVDRVSASDANLFAQWSI